MKKETLKINKNGEALIFTKLSTETNGQLTEFESMDGQILLPKTAIPYVGWIAKFLDTEDNLICAMQYDNTAR